jgi:hypothetical protein
MARSRSSFDLAGAIATAASLSTTTTEEAPSAAYRTMALVSFGPTAAGPPSLPPPIPEVEAAVAAPDSAVLPPSSQTDGPPTEDVSGAAKRPPRLPDLSEVQSPTERCEHILAWITEAVGAQDVFIADAAGLTIAGATADIEGRVAASGVVASAVAHLAASMPGKPARLFELHIGEGPFFQVIGFEIAKALYLVGLTRATPLTYRQAHAIRLACRHALGEPSSGVDLEATRPGEPA